MDTHESNVENPSHPEQDPIKEMVEKYALNDTERLLLLIAIAPFYFGGPRAMLRAGQEVDVERYAQEIVAMRLKTIPVDELIVGRHDTA